MAALRKSEGYITIQTASNLLAMFRCRGSTRTFKARRTRGKKKGLNGQGKYFGKTR
ncbi:hypothetical protein NC653_041584 [Populus alba x Populus x berolinensis]|uniref:Uncharacterized protein n=1 Tax=Populus alba x Populus x berolinensis TaxID=444605 RepID=A0AAD6L8Y1_9ROSI|nr:hypothetical protein NC653_041584 [Populus alba x Populus x berolinensis]